MCSSSLNECDGSQGGPHPGSLCLKCILPRNGCGALVEATAALPVDSQLPEDIPSPCLLLAVFNEFVCRGEWGGAALQVSTYEEAHRDSTQRTRHVRCLHLVCVLCTLGPPPCQWLGAERIVLTMASSLDAESHSAGQRLPGGVKRAKPAASGVVVGVPAIHAPNPSASNADLRPQTVRVSGGAPPPAAAVTHTALKTLELAPSPVTVAGFVGPTSKVCV